MLAALELELAAATEVEQGHRAAAQQARERAGVAHATLAVLQRLLGEAMLLEGGHHLAPRRDELARAHAVAATREREEPATTADARRRLAELIDALRAPLADDAALAAPGGAA